MNRSVAVTLMLGLFAATAPAQPLEEPASDPHACEVLWPEGASRDAFILETWPGGRVPYAFDANVEPVNRDRARAAMEEIMLVSGVRFTPRTTENDYLLIRSSTGNSSFVGRIGGPQPVNIASWSVRFIIVHELLHALGDNHEQSRPDRDEYVTILYENIQPGREGNFEIRFSAVPEGPYDFESVMHYGPRAFSTSFANTIEVRPPYEMYQSVIGQRERLSEGDVLGLVTRYGTLEADYTLDGRVNSADLGILLGGWGGELFDLDGDGVVGSSDLGVLLSQWR